MEDQNIEQRKESGNIVEFGDRKWKDSLNVKRKESKFTDFLLKKFGAYIKDEGQANKVLIIFAAICIFLSIILLIRIIRGPSKLPSQFRSNIIR